MRPFHYRATEAISFVLNRIQKVIIKVLDLVILSWLAIYYVSEALILTVTPTFLRKQKDLRGKIILLTGGAGGVGQELAIRLVRQKAIVVIWDNNEKALEKVQEKIESQGHKVHTYPVDISDRANVYKYADIVKSDVGPVDIILNNAGIVCGQTFLEIPDHMIEKTFKVNILSHYWTIKAFLPHMIKTGKGHIVTVGSLTGLLGTYKCTDYSASKHATIGLHESLLIELKTHGHHNIKMTLVCPYFINTGMFAGCKPRNLKMLEPKEVAKRIITAIKNEEVYVTIPTFSRFFLPIKNFIPAKLAWAFIYRIIQGPQSMMGMRNFEEVEAA
ncbi:hypothetical protein Zmor_012756 [Zophobas morio]|uniref:Short-chain dehydrogenase/reductase 3 n=1 Tax=Zophobas morio TaxID=2755281 RepID=A0AA38IC08_9CUCU|nr:hypothetical protein Zmor_012756 [Zophobas morio]